MRMPISMKVMTLSFISSVVIISLLGYLYYTRSYSDMQDKYATALKHIALSAAVNISGDDHAVIREPDDYKTREFKKIRAHLERIQKVNNLQLDLIYTFDVKGFDPKKNKVLTFCVMLQKKTYISHKYNVPPENANFYYQVMSGKAVGTPIYGDENGHFISGLAPIYDSSGKVNAILQVDYRLDQVIAAQRQILYTILILSSIVAAVSILVSLFLAGTISRPIRKLKYSVDKLREGDYDVVAKISSHDETRDLADAFNEMAHAIKESHDKIEEEKARSEELLLNILPRPIADRLKSENQPIADGFSNVTVLFADIVGFTKMAEFKPPEEVVGMLNGIFSSFDALCEMHGVEKIKTIGDAYMAAAGIPTPSPTHAEKVAEMALDMMEAVREFPFEGLQIRIGINSGPVVAGVIGSSKFIYDLWGDAVNRASRMEAYGLTDNIQVSEETYDLLKDKYEFRKRGTIVIKRKKEFFTTYFLIGRKDSPANETVPA